jgi:hypothetical protein
VASSGTGAALGATPAASQAPIAFSRNGYSRVVTMALPVAFLLIFVAVRRPTLDVTVKSVKSAPGSRADQARAAQPAAAI